MAVREILRDARNHEDAKVISGAQLSLNLAPFPIAAFNEIAHAKSLQRVQSRLERNDIHELFRWIGSLTYSGDIDTLIALRNNADYRDQFWSLLLTDRHPLSELKARIDDGLSKIGFVAESFGSAPLQTAGVAGVAIAGVSVAVTRRWINLGGALAVGGAITSALPLAHSEARRLSFIPDDLYSGPAWPFLLAANSGNPTRNQIHQLVHEITNVLEQ
jgi:hypothetical protein